MDREGYEPVVRFVAARLPRPRPLVVGIGGGVAVGKSTAAAVLAEQLAPARTAIVATDGFLHPNARLEREGLVARKGFPETYDEPALLAFLHAVRSNHPGVGYPVYSHETYDVVPGPPRPLAPSDVLVLEGVTALRFADLLDVAVYVDAAEASMEQWYTRRFLELCAAPPPGTFYAGFAGSDTATLEAIARAVWREVNLVNLREHIVATRARADAVIEKDLDHSVRRVRFTGVPV